MCVKLVIYWNGIKMHGHQNIKKSSGSTHTFREQGQQNTCPDANNRFKKLGAVHYVAVVRVVHCEVGVTANTLLFNL
jgi:hypothetical protein